MTTIREWFNAFSEATGENVYAIVLGWEHGWGDYNADEWPAIPSGVTPLADLSDDVLDRDFDDGFGGNQSPNLCAWSVNFVLFSDNYDGAESLQWVPRNPTTHEPIRPGGG